MIIAVNACCFITTEALRSRRSILLIEPELASAISGAAMEVLFTGTFLRELRGKFRLQVIQRRFRGLKKN